VYVSILTQRNVQYGKIPHQISLSSLEELRTTLNNASGVRMNEKLLYKKDMPMLWKKGSIYEIN